MRKLRTILVPIAALSLIAAACGGDDDSSDSVAEDTAEETGGEDTAAEATAAEDTASEDTVDASQGSDLTFHMITHSDGGPFWSVVKRGMEAACADLGVDCVWGEVVIALDDYRLIALGDDLTVESCSCHGETVGRTLRTSYVG